MSEASRRAVAIGGGTGLPNVLRCLLDTGFDTTAVVTMADDGGSSGKLRRDLGILPPGDIRNCLAAMAAPDNPNRELFQYRFKAGEGLEGHSLGNLIIAALADTHGGFIEGLEAAEEMLDVRGRVLPSTTESVLLTAVDSDGNPIRGQAKIAQTQGPIADVRCEPASPRPHPPAISAIESADVVVVGPGSLFTSLIPNFLVDGLTDAVCRSSAIKVFVCNLANQRGETSGMNALDHVEALVSHGLGGVFDVVVVHEGDSATGEPASRQLCDDSEAESVCADAEVRAGIEGLGLRVVTGDLVDPECPTRHHADKLCQLLSEVVR